MDFDLILVGGGLASGLVALRLAQCRPECVVGIVETSDRIGGDHIWSTFEGDLTDAQREWTRPLRAAEWPSHEVRFPAYRRQLGLGYWSARSSLLDAAVRAAVPAERLFFGVSATTVAADGVVLSDGRALSARVVIDGRGHSASPALELAWQKFVGHEIATEAPHGIERPIVMDATVPQHDGYRFVYVLPFDRHRLLVEDTYYSSDAVLDDMAVDRRVADYVAASGWGAYKMLRRERGALPIALGGDIEALIAENPRGVAAIGMRAALFHPVTGYSFPEAVRTADHIARLPRMSGYAANALAIHAHRHWHTGSYYRLLNRMMFRAARPEERYRVLQHFYRLPEPLVTRFYAATSTHGDKLRILSGKPPVPVHRALAVLVGIA